MICICISIIFCKRCFESDRKATLEVQLGDPENPLRVMLKKEFKKQPHEEHVAEAIITCDVCNVRYHQICVNYNADIWKQMGQK